MKANLCLYGVLAVVVGVVWHERDQARQMVDEQEREALLDARLKVTLGRIDYRQKVVEDLVAGQITLASAAAKFEELNATYAGGTAAVLSFPGVSEEESRYRQVIGQVKVMFENRPSEASVIVERLEAELRKHMGRSTIGT
jgi:hypothetical protein